jgi:hypothetical protein
MPRWKWYAPAWQEASPPEWEDEARSHAVAMAAQTPRERRRDHRQLRPGNRVPDQERRPPAAGLEQPIRRRPQRSIADAKAEDAFSRALADWPGRPAWEFLNRVHLPGVDSGAVPGGDEQPDQTS